ncbi:MAG: hypothetical protein ACR2KK_09975 [Acidimicrobiales bacterium]
MARLLGVTALFVTLIAAPAQAQSAGVDRRAPLRPSGPGLAWFEGRMIDLSED